MRLAKRERPDGEIGAPMVGRTSETSVVDGRRGSGSFRAVARGALVVLGWTAAFTVVPPIIAPVCVSVGSDVLAVFAACVLAAAFLVKR
jgi:hypothetical protein